MQEARMRLMILPASCKTRGHLNAAALNDF
jgi:hypothetical protein